MTLNFRALSFLSAGLCFFIACTWMFAPDILLTVWGVPYSESVGFVARRGAVLFGAIGTMFVVARNAEISLARYGLIIGFAFGCAALAALGLFEFVAGHAGPGILSAVVVEVVLALAFIVIGRDDRFFICADPSTSFHLRRKDGVPVNFALGLNMRRHWVGNGHSSLNGHCLTSQSPNR